MNVKWIGRKGDFSNIVDKLLAEICDKEQVYLVLKEAKFCQHEYQICDSIMVL